MDNQLAIVIEDEKDLALIFAEALAAAGFRPEIFYDGEPALSRLIEIVPEIIVLDLNLPNITGFRSHGTAAKRYALGKRKGHHHYGQSHQSTSLPRYGRPHSRKAN